MVLPGFLGIVDQKVLLRVHERLAGPAHQIAPTRGRTVVLEALAGFECTFDHGSRDPYVGIPALICLQKAPRRRR